MANVDFGCISFVYLLALVGTSERGAVAVERNDLCWQESGIV